MASPVFSRVDYSLIQLLDGIELGSIGLPEIQQPFVWKTAKVRDRLDSMYRGYPVGQLLLWASPTNGEAKTIGADAKQKAPDSLILDGQQRLTSLYSVLNGHEILDENFKGTSDLSRV